MKWLRTLLAGTVFQQTRRPTGAIIARRQSLSLETLEDRYLLATGVSVFKVPMVNPTTRGLPLGITAGPDGNLWFTDKAAHAAGKITPAGVITEYPTTLSKNPLDLRSPEEIQTARNIVSEPDGNLWFTDYQSNHPVNSGLPYGTTQSEVVKVTPAGVVTEFTLPDGSSRPLGITVGPDGKLWFAESRANKIGSITTDGAIQEFTVPNIANTQFSPFSVLNVTTGPDGNLWYTEFAAKVGRITPKGDSLGEVIVSSPARGITAGPDGNIWVTETRDAIARITPAGTVTEFNPSAGASVFLAEITAGPDGNLWFVKNSTYPAAPDPKIASIRPDGALGVALSIPTSLDVVPDITVGPNGTLWFTEFFEGGIGEVHNYVETLFESVLGRKASRADLNYWDNVWGQNGQAAVATGVQGSDEAHALLVQGWYQTYLGRKAEAGGQQYFVNLLRTGTEEQALAQLFASPEYYNHAPSVSGVGGGTASDTTFVQALYQQLLGRAAGAGEVTYWQPQVAAQGRSAVALQIMTSDEYRRDAIQNAYHALLHRSSPAAAADVNYWLSLNLDNQSLKVAFEQTDEFAHNG